MEGYRDEEFTKKFLNYIEDLNFADLTEDDKRLLFSHAIKFNSVSHRAYLHLKAWIDQWEFDSHD